jgi:hypothetical protein
MRKAPLYLAGAAAVASVIKIARSCWDWQSPRF